MDDNNQLEVDGMVEAQFSEDDAHPWLPERLERARNSAVRSLLEEAGGYADVAALRTDLSDLSYLRERVAGLEAQSQAAHVDRAFREACAAYQFHDLKEVWALADLSGVLVAEDGVVSGMAEAIEALVAARPHLVKRPPAPALDAGEVSAVGDSGLSRPEVEQVKRRFRL